MPQARGVRHEPDRLEGAHMEEREAGDVVRRPPAGPGRPVLGAAVEMVLGQREQLGPEFELGSRGIRRAIEESGQEVTGEPRKCWKNSSESRLTRLQLVREQRSRAMFPQCSAASAIAAS